ncbi:class I SAM-dependent methyltransferase [Flavisphingomonas formosensis]|uniref:hypothetical protein n=1 Tax=Flavisphingomonas formosensis TaxID=861534 RepID=UPI0012FB3A23|nr:hypothetical protein [Sphingomonas formosensis]
MGSSSGEGEPLASSNSGYDWDAFDSEAYLDHYYREPHPDDVDLARRTAAAIAAAPPAGAALDIIDVGTGPNLFPWLCALPRARSLTAWEYSRQNVDWLREELAGDELRPLWRYYWDVVSPGHVPDENPVAAIAAIARVEQASIFDLPKAQWDLATMFFCAESITRSEAEFASACRALAEAVRPGGTLVAAFLDQSRGYVVADRPFPALPVDADAIRAAFHPYVGDISVEPIGGSEAETHSGYTGSLFMVARTR